MDAALARLVADAADAGDDASKLTEALKQAGLETNNDVIVYDFDDDEAQAARGTPAEEKYRALARDATRALVDKELRPDAEEGRALKRVMSAPGDSLASSDLELLWKFRHALTGEKKALPKFLLAVDWRDASEVAQVPALLKQWTRIDVADAIKLLGPDQAYQRRVVRACVEIKILRRVRVEPSRRPPPDALVDFHTGESLRRRRPAAGVGHGAGDLSATISSSASL